MEALRNIRTRNLAVIAVIVFFMTIGATVKSTVIWFARWATEPGVKLYGFERRLVRSNPKVGITLVVACAFGVSLVKPASRIDMFIIAGLLIMALSMFAALVRRPGQSLL